MAEKAKPDPQKLKFKLREQIQIEEASGVPIGMIKGPQGQSAKVLAAMCWVLLRREKADVTHDEVLDLDDDDILAIFDRYIPNPTPAEDSASDS